MKEQEQLIKKLHQSANLLICDTRASRCYGTDNVLTYSDLSFLKCIERNSHAKAKEISLFLGITNGAVAQMSKKLEEKGYLETYRVSDNKKEVYYRLKKKGIDAMESYNRRSEELNSQIEDYLQNLDQKEIQAVEGLFDKVIEIIEMNKGCYIKETKEETAQEDRRCEKCKIIY